MNTYLRLGAVLLAASSLSVSASALAQTEAVMIGQSASDRIVLPQGTSVRLRTLTALSSQESKVGQRFDLEVAEDVMLNGQVVIPRGSPAVGEVAKVKKKGMWGKSGKLETRVLSVRAHGRDIPIRGEVGEKGDTGTAGVVASIVVLPLAGFFVTGTSAVMPVGSPANGILESDLPIMLARPMMVQPAVVETPVAAVTSVAVQAEQQ